MLILEPRNDRYLMQSVQASRVGLDRNIISIDGLSAGSHNPRFRGHYLGGKTIGFPDLPYLFNIDKYIQDTIILQETLDSTFDMDIINQIIVAYTNIAVENQNHLIYLRMYANDYTCLDDYFANLDGWLVHESDNIAALYGKTMLDTKDRNEVYNIPNMGARIINSLEHNIVIEVVNYDDEEQASDYYLTLGIIPMLFENIKELLNEDEKNLLKEFIRRSQVKRIRNVECENLYYRVYTSNKYQDAMKDFRFKAQIEAILNSRRSRVRRRINEAMNAREDALQRYQNALRELETATNMETQLQNDDAIKEEISMVTRMQPVIDFDVQGDNIYITLRTNLEYYDPDLLDITLSRNQDRYDSAITTQFFRDVFIDEKYKYYVMNRYPFNIADGNLSLPQSIVYTCYNRNLNALYNPHIEYYKCYGSNETQIIKAHRDKDLIGYVNALISSLKNVNFADSAVFSRWYNNIKAMLTGADDENANDYKYCTFLEDRETGEMLSLLDYARRHHERQEPEEDIEEIEVREL